MTFSSLFRLYRRILGILCLGFAAAGAVLAADDDGEVPLLALNLEELVNLKVAISTNTSQSLTKAPSVVSVITADDIKATGTTNLMEILQSVPGIYIRANQFGFRPWVSFRGSTGPHVLLMVNGAPMRDLVWSSGLFWKGLPASMIDRVEIIRGPGSALFGSDASAGVINVITKTARTIDHSEIGARAGNFDSQSGWLQHGAEWNGFDIGLTAEVSRTDGHRPTILRDSQSAHAISPATSLAPSRAEYGWDNQDLRFSISKGNWRLLADHMHHGNLGIGITGGSVLDPRTRASDSQSSVALLYYNENYAQEWGLNAELRYRDLEYSSGNGFIERPPGFSCTTARNCSGATPGTYADGYINRMSSAERRANAEIGGLYRGFHKHAVRLGAGYVWQDIYRVEQSVNFGTGPTGVLLPAGGPLVSLNDTPYAFVPKRSRINSYLFLQDVWTLNEDWELTAGARYDRYSDFGGAWSPRLALVWQTTPRLTTKLLHGQAFRAPSYLELYAITAASAPNPALSPERSRTWDLSFNFAATRDFKLGVNFYEFMQRNLISDATGQYQNSGSRDTHGIEFEADWQVTRTLKLSAAMTRRNKDETLLNVNAVPYAEAFLRADWAFLPRWNWNLQANWAGERLLRSTDTRPPLGAQTITDTTLRYSPDRHWEFAASIRNLFDTDAREYTSSAIPYHLPLPERSFFAEARYKF